MMKVNALKAVKMLKKTLMIAAFTGLLGMLSVTAVYAGDCKPGCYCPAAGTAGPGGSANYGGVLGAMEDRANAIRVRDRGYKRELSKQTDNSVGMTCMDHGLALTSRLGQLFSDKTPTGFVAGNNRRVFGASTYPGFGADQWLATALRVTVNGSMANHATNFPFSLSAIIGATILNFFGGFMGTINGFISNIQSFMATLQTYVNTFNNLVTALQTIITMLNGSTPTWILALVTAINAAWSAISNFINTMIGAVQSAITAVMTTISNFIMGVMGSLTNFSGPTGECSRIQQLWGNQQPAMFFTGAVRALTGTSIETGTQYLNFRQLLGGSPMPGGMTPANALDILGELNPATTPNNSSFINRALNNINAGGSLNAPGNMLPWKIPTVYAPGTAAATIIGAM
jgi:hypothetical protein